MVFCDRCGGLTGVFCWEVVVGSDRFGVVRREWVCKGCLLPGEGGLRVGCFK